MTSVTGRASGLAQGLALLLPLALMGACDGGDDRDGFSSEEWKVIQSLQPLGTPMPRNPYNHRDQDVGVEKFAQKIFFETEYSDAITIDNHPSGKKGEAGKISCASCHDPKGYFVETRIDPNTNARYATSPALGAPGKRTAPGILNDGYQIWAGWTGRHDSLMMHGAGVSVFVSNHLALVHFIYKKYKDEYNTLFPDNPLNPALDPMAPDAARFPATGRPKATPMAADGPFEKMTPEDQKFMYQFMYNMGRLWDTYPRFLVTHDSPFENYCKGDFAALSPEQKRGLKLFIGKASCSDCHNGPTLTDTGFHNVGVPQPGAPDLGRQADLGTTKANIYNGAGEFSDDREAGRKKLEEMPAVTDSMVGQFRTPTLLNIAETYPYFHTGQFRTLEEVVAHYNHGGADTNFSGNKDPKIKPLGLTGEETSDLVAFLKSLTGVVDPDLAKDIRPPAPGMMPSSM
jgi:cytochrome c peroxidase